MLRVNLHAFILVCLALVIVLYMLVRLIAGILHVPGRMQRFGVARKGRQAAAALNNAGLAFFEAQISKAGAAAKALANKEAGDNRTLALMLGAHAADQMDDAALRDRYLKDIETLPAKAVFRYLLLAESALVGAIIRPPKTTSMPPHKSIPALTPPGAALLKPCRGVDHGTLEVLDNRQAA